MVRQNKHIMNPPDFTLRIEAARQRLLQLTYEERKQRVPRYYVDSWYSPVSRKRWLNREEKIREGVVSDVNTLITSVFTKKTPEEKLKALQALEDGLAKTELKKSLEPLLFILAPVLIVVFITVIQYLGF